MSEDKRRERIRRFRLIDNAFMKVFFKDNYEAAEGGLSLKHDAYSYA